MLRMPADPGQQAAEDILESTHTEANLHQLQAGRRRDYPIMLQAKALRSQEPLTVTQLAKGMRMS